MAVYHVTCPFSGERYEFSSKDALRGFVASMMAQQPDCDRTIRLYADGTLFGTMKKVSDGAVFRQAKGRASYYVKKDGSLGSAYSEPTAPGTKGGRIRFPPASEEILAVSNKGLVPYMIPYPTKKGFGWAWGYNEIDALGDAIRHIDRMDPIPTDRFPVYFGRKKVGELYYSYDRLRGGEYIHESNSMVTVRHKNGSIKSLTRKPGHRPSWVG